MSMPLRRGIGLFVALSLDNGSTRGTLGASDALDNCGDKLPKNVKTKKKY